MSYSLPISSSYRKPVFEALVLQMLLGLLSALILDGGTTARICGIALIAFWAGAAVLIWRHPQMPTRTDITFVRFGYLPVVVLAFFLVHFIWHVRGVE
jgi:hypothetical protein